MSVQNKIVGGIGAIAGAAVGLSAVASSGASKQQLAKTKAMKSMRDELEMKLAQEQLKGQRLANRIARKQLRSLSGEVKKDVQKE